MTRRLRTANYPQDSRRHLAGAVTKARQAAGHKSRASFARAAGVSVRSLAAVESLEPDTASVGEAVLHAIGRALPTWTEDTPRIILEGGPIPANGPVNPQADPEAPGEQLGPLDEVLTATVTMLAKLARYYAWYTARQENRDQDPADEERFMQWAMDMRKQRG